MDGIVWTLAIVVLVLAGALVLERRRFLARLDQERTRFVTQEVERIRAEERELATRQAKTELVRWRQDEEGAIRSDAIRRSQDVTRGKVTEHLLPYFDDFPFDPRCCRFLGSPVDLVAFPLGEEGYSVVLLEVKTGRSQLTPEQRGIRDAVRAGRVYWQEMRVP
jgi:predicted Holliday junction resolvase-like endonuclease